MNRDLALYLLGLKNEISRDIWLTAISKSARNGTVNLMYKDLLIENRIKTKAELQRVFNPSEAAGLEIIKILIQTDSFISINFYKGTKQQASKTQLKKAEKELAQKLEPAEQTPNLPSVVKTQVVKGFTEKITEPYTPSYALTQSVIGDYIIFFKQLQIDKVLYGTGMVMTQADAAPPEITAEDVKHFKALCLHFAKLPKMESEEMIKRCFRQIYNNWYNLTEFVQKGFQPRAIRGNINTIIIQLQDKKNGNQSKRENTISKKNHRAGSKDYSALVNPRNKDN